MFRKATRKHRVITVCCNARSRWDARSRHCTQNVSDSPRFLSALRMIFEIFFRGREQRIFQRARIWESRHLESPLAPSGRSIGRFVERHIVPACFLSFYVISAPILARCVPPSRSALFLALFLFPFSLSLPLSTRLDSASCIGLYVLRKQTNQYQSLKLP